MTAPQPSSTQAAADTGPIIQITGMNKWYGDFHVLKNIDLDVNRQERVVICGPSGSGKSTLIRTINRLEEHQRGEIVVDGTRLTNDLKHIELVRREVGMVFQQFNLFPHLSVLDNVMLAPVWVRRMPREDAVRVAMELLERVGIPEQARKFPGQLSGGQQQRVAIARALANQPAILLADEPTGALDSKTGTEIIGLFQQLHRDLGQTVVYVTHDPFIARHTRRVVRMADGKIVADERIAEPLKAGVPRPSEIALAAPVQS